MNQSKDVLVVSSRFCQWFDIEIVLFIFNITFNEVSEGDRIKTCMLNLKSYINHKKFVKEVFHTGMMMELL